MRQPEFEIQADAEVRGELEGAYHESLIAPLDDMWAAFAAAARAHSLLVDGERAGFCAVNEEREILAFHLRAEYEDLAEALFDHLVARLQLIAAIACTVDPAFLSLSLSAGQSTVTRALMFHHVLEPEGPAVNGLRLASEADHSAAVAFAEAATGAPRTFLEPYLGARIEKAELLLCEERSEILASGECRLDQRWPEYAHLGMIVDRRQRGKGLGTRLMHALVLESRRRKLEPLCSTEPDNLAARHAIHRAGFRSRHRVLRVALDRKE